ncbi:hypothetical protein [Actinomadura atramentaria]|uniref:hypothetical protein n=1 Tax=Actinomadura atramentaria TaxID=1990 RepID=UPI0012FC184A|nr:hypothetical protein [Actinomadura atramentaria]
MGFVDSSTGIVRGPGGAGLLFTALVGTLALPFLQWVGFFAVTSPGDLGEILPSVFGCVVLNAFAVLVTGVMWEGAPRVVAGPFRWAALVHVSAAALAFPASFVALFLGLPGFAAAEAGLTVLTALALTRLPGARAARAVMAAPWALYLGGLAIVSL